MQTNYAKNKVVILDRDGVINYDSDNYIKSPEEWIPLPHSLEAISKLKQAGYKVAVATNQSGIARGYYDLDTLNAMHSKMQSLLAEFGANVKVDYISYCPHGPEDGCNCRKPKPGMLLEIASYFSIAPKEVIFVGDKASDQQAAESANMQFALVRTGYGEETAKASTKANRNQSYDTLAAWVNDFLK